MLTTTWLLIALSVAGISSWLGRGATTPAWKDARMYGGLALGAVGLAVPPEHFVHGAFMAGSAGLLTSFVSTEVAAARPQAAAEQFGSYAYYAAAPQYAYVG